MLIRPKQSIDDENFILAGIVSELLAIENRIQSLFWVYFVHSRIFFVTFSPFFLYLCIYRERQLRRFSIYHFLSRGSVQKMAAKLKFGQKLAFHNKK